MNENTKPDQWMEFHGHSFFQAVEGLPDQTAMKYLRLLWHYWSHNHCKGLVNDEKYLKRVCRADEDEWPLIKQFILDNENFFKKEHGLWHQKFARELWNRKIETIERNKQRTEAALAARWKGKRK